MAGLPIICPQCGHKIERAELLRCPRCNKALFVLTSCSGCTKCNSFTKCAKPTPM